MCSGTDPNTTAACVSFLYLGELRDGGSGAVAMPLRPCRSATPCKHLLLLLLLCGLAIHSTMQAAPAADWVCPLTEKQPDYPPEFLNMCNAHAPEKACCAPINDAEIEEHFAHTVDTSPGCLRDQKRGKSGGALEELFCMSCDPNQNVWLVKNATKVPNTVNTVKLEYKRSSGFKASAIADVTKDDCITWDRINMTDPTVTGSVKITSCVPPALFGSRTKLTVEIFSDRNCKNNATRSSISVVVNGNLPARAGSSSAQLWAYSVVNTSNTTVSTIYKKRDVPVSCGATRDEFKKVGVEDKGIVRLCESFANKVHVAVFGHGCGFSVYTNDEGTVQWGDVNGATGDDPVIPSALWKSYLVNMLNGVVNDDQVLYIRPPYLDEYYFEIVRDGSGCYGSAVRAFSLRAWMLVLWALALLSTIIH